MKYERFEDLRVWQDAIELAVRVFTLTARPNFAGSDGLKDQIEQVVVSISNNIAEGFERGTTSELLTFLSISRGSAGATRSLLCLTDRLRRFEDLRSEILDLRSRTESISRQLCAWADSMQNSETRGQQCLIDSVALPRRKRATMTSS
jgi:four helix bundle protein